MRSAFLFGIATSSAFISSAAIAADLPNRKQPPAQIPVSQNVSWTGAYLGLNGGLVDANATGTDRAIIGNANGGVFGVTGGFNAQMPSNIVVGIEGDYGMSNADGTGTVGSGKIETLTTIRARAGVAIDRVLPFITGGYAGGQLELVNGGSRDTEYVNGWTMGGGAEYAFSDNVSAKAEALYIELDEADVPTADEAGYKAGIYRLGLNYRF